MDKHKIREGLIAAAAIMILVLFVMTVNTSKHNIIGKAFYSPVKVHGTVMPFLPDGTDIVFKVDRIEIASTVLKDNAYGYDPEVVFKMDDASTPAKEGYTPGDIVKIYIADVEAGQFSYVTGNTIEKNIILPVGKRTEISENAALGSLCTPDWECSIWSECVDDMQTRECYDNNICGTEEGKPAESQDCVTEVEVPYQPKIGRVAMLLILLGIIVIAVIIGLLIKCKKKKAPKAKMKVQKKKVMKKASKKRVKKKKKR